MIVLAQRTLSVVQFNRSVSSAIRATVMIVAIVACSAIFSNYLAFTRITHRMLEFVATTDMSREMILGIIILVLLLMGMFMDQLAILSLAMPLAFPTAMALDFDPIWFGVLVVVLVELGLITPPVGMNLFIIKAQVPQMPMGTLYRAITPFLAAPIVLVGLLFALPGIALWLPGVLF